MIGAMTQLLDMRDLPAAVLTRLADQGAERRRGPLRPGLDTVRHTSRGPTLFEARQRGGSGPADELRVERRQDGETDTAEHVGYACVYGVEYNVFGGPPYGWVEVIEPGASARSLGMGADVRYLVNHDGLALARTRSGTLQLSEDDLGLRQLATVDLRSQTAVDLTVSIERRDTDQMSYAFRAVAQEWNEDYTERRVLEQQIVDTSSVTYPANEATLVMIGGGEWGVGGDGHAAGLNLNSARAEWERLQVRANAPE
jgi:HK97 family phage prohead protease